MRAVITGALFFASCVTLFADKQQEIAQVEEELRQAYLEADVLALQRLLADDYKVVHVNGREQNKAQFIDSLQSGRAKFLSVEVDEKEVRDFGHTAIYTARITDSGKDEKGAPFEVTTLVTTVFLRRDGNWKMVQHHESLLQK